MSVDRIVDSVMAEMIRAHGSIQDETYDNLKQTFYEVVPRAIRAALAPASEEGA